MTTLDLHPAPRAASPAHRVWNHGRTEASLVLRNGEQVVLALVVPIAILVAGRYLGGHVDLPIGVLAPSVLALAIWSTCFTSQAIMTGFERRYGVLERLCATPLGRSGLLAGKSLAYALISAGQVIVLAVIAVALGWRPLGSPIAWLPALLSVVLAMMTFGLAGLALAGSLKAEVTLGLANLLYLVGMIAGIMWPLRDYPNGLRQVVAVLPTTALGESLRSWGIGMTAWWPVGSLLCWAAVLALVARRTFRWVS
ncbi:ABC transporter permease [Acidipropionibacterium timonense]|uniref:ABC transporter permease n=1 Tax=Acidipropionibacterium timonense TaxID=2161818 RepID=UPI001030B82A|nr:ABC transporter permease [Acidipropionibacterium timonense]